MAEEEKIFEIESGNTVYQIRFRINGDDVKAHCTCPAGDHKKICRHVLQCLEEDFDLKYKLIQLGYLQVYEEHLARKDYAEEVKKEAANLKKKFERMFLE